MLFQRQVLRLERPGLEGEPRFWDGGTTQNGREGKARPGVRLLSLDSAPRVLALVGIAFDILVPRRGCIGATLQLRLLFNTSGFSFLHPPILSGVWKA